jgi:uncharacterized membrane protein
MKIIPILFRTETRVPMLALAFASAASVALVLARILWTENIRYAFLLWNLFLAWVPLVFAMLASEEHRNSGRHWHLLGLAGAWLLFFPNAPYILTDLIHLTSRFQSHFWIDLTLILLCAFTGLLLGFLSLYLMQGVVARLFGTAASWVFVAVSAGLSSFGVYLGRFLRFNSWDVVVSPLKIYRGIGDWLTGPYLNRTSFAFLVLFATFLFVSYVMLYALTHLSPTRSRPSINDAGKTNEA